MPVEIVIVGCGLVTPVGLSAKETAASAASRTARLISVEWRDSRQQRFTVGAVPDDGLNPLLPEIEAQPLTYRERRMLRLGDVALAEALAALPKSAGQIPLLLGLPEIHNLRPIVGREFLSRLKQQAAAPLDLGASEAIANGRSSGIEAIAKALALLTDGKTKFVLIGGVDSYLDLYIMGTLDLQKRVRTEVNSNGFAPGEGAGFLLLTSREIAQQFRMPIFAQIKGCALGKEEGHIYSENPYRGDGLAETWENLFNFHSDIPPIGTVYASFNGENYWAKEFGVSFIRHRERFVESHQMEHPAECFGDLGSAHGAVMAGLAALRLQQNLASPPILVYASSDYGTRSVVVLAPPSLS